MLTLVTFRDRDPWYRPDATGHNKCGYIDQKGSVTYPRFLGVVTKPLHAINKYPYRLIQVESPIDPSSLDFFIEHNRFTPNLFQRFMLALYEHDSVFFSEPVKLPILKTISEVEYEAKWDYLLQSIRPCDIVCTFDSTSLISKAIVSIENGVWSHTAQYVGNGKIVEATTSGVIESEILKYKSKNYRIAVYRLKGLKNQDEVVHFARTQLNKRYNYRGVVRLALRKLRALPPEAPSKVSPSDLPVYGNFELIVTI